MKRPDQYEQDRFSSDRFTHEELLGWQLNSVSTQAYETAAHCKPHQAMSEAVGLDPRNNDYLEQSASNTNRINAFHDTTTCTVKTTPQMTRFRDVKVCKNLVTDEIDDHRIQSDYKCTIGLQYPEGKNSTL